MSVGIVTVNEVSLVDPPHHNKYYRIYVLPNGIEIREYGPIGAANPQYKVVDNGSKSAAEVSAGRQMDAKRKKGYDSLTTAAFNFDMSKWRGDPKVVTNVYRASESGPPWPVGTGQPQVEPSSVKPTKPTSRQLADAVSTGVQTDRLADFTDRAASVITMSVTDESAALVEFAKLQGEWGEHEESYQKARSYLDTLEALVGK